MIVSAPRDRGSGRPRMTRRQIRFYRIASGCLGAFIVLIALIVFLGQGSQIRTRALVLSEHCHSAFDVALAEHQTRCNLAVEFSTGSGQQIRTTVGDALESEISTAGHRRFIDLRYDSGHPAQPYKQSNYMSAPIFAMLLAIGCGAILLGIWGWLARLVRRSGKAPVAAQVKPFR
jgi:hypothetical protein